MSLTLFGISDLIRAQKSHLRIHLKHLYPEYYDQNAEHDSEHIPEWLQPGMHALSFGPRMHHRRDLHNPELGQNHQDGMPLYRNFDQEFDKLLSKPSAERKLSVRMEFQDNAFGFTLSMTDETGARIMLTQPFEKEPARRDQAENIRTQLSKLGNTPFEAVEVTVAMSDNWVVPSSTSITDVSSDQGNSPCARGRL